MCLHHYEFEPQGFKTSTGRCRYCGDTISGLNGFPDSAYEHGRTFPLISNPRRVIDNNVERILNDRRYPHIFNRNIDFSRQT
jgi:hypothetical protein